MEYEAMVARNKEILADRAGMLDRARNLIDWLEAHPDVPLSRVEITYSVPAIWDDEGEAQIEAIARAAGLPSTRDGAYHHVIKAEDDDLGQLVRYSACYIESWKRR